MSDIEGFESPKHQYSLQSDHIITIKSKIADIAKSILKQKKHSLEPDMQNGWKPKLPCCPLPITYINSFNQQLMHHIPTDERFKIVYLGKRYVNSVQINQQYNYFWKYRQRYSLNLALVEEAVQNVGQNHKKIMNDIFKFYSRNNLCFDSSFQSGNLQLAVKVKSNQYDLFLRSDTNTKGHTNWYYFKVNNQDFIGTVQFNICNLNKTKTLYNKGMKPYVLDNDTSNWSQQKTFDVCFVERYSRYGFDKKTFQLQFKYNFKKPNQQVFFAYGIPYTYSRLQEFLKQITYYNKSLIKSEKLCQSLGGLNIPLLTISDQLFIRQLKQQEQNHNHLNQKHYSKKLFYDKEEMNQHRNNKRAVLITARIHPGQSNASHVLDGFLKQLLTENQISRKVRENYVFYIIPMLNPDGVVAGNFRTSYSGKDLNRQFKKLNKFLYPQIYHLSELALKLKNIYKKRFEFYFDFHGHSSKKNIFCYGPEYPTTSNLYFKSKTFAKIIEEVNPIFNYHRSIFHISEQKKTTGRAYMLWQVKIPMTYTFQVSNGMYDSKQTKNIHLNQESLNLAGETVCKGFFKFAAISMSQFGSVNIKAKVDSGIRNRRSTSTQKMIKQRSLIIPKFNSYKQINEFNQVTQSVRITELTNFIDENMNKELQKYLNQINKQDKLELQQAEGGSDSENQQDDLSRQDLKRLEQFIISRDKQTTQYSKNKFNFKIQAVEKQMKKKSLLFEQNDNKENKRTENLRIKLLPKKSVDWSKKSLQVSNKSVGLKKPPLLIAPVMPKIYEKVVLNQVNYKFEF